MSPRTKKKTLEKKAFKEPPKKKYKWCVLYGFKASDPDEVGFLSFRSASDIKLNPRAGIYRIVDDIEEAKHFPCENYLSADSFASPEKWLDFFKEEDELKDWRFHLSTRTFTSNEKMMKKAQQDIGENDNVVES